MQQQHATIETTVIVDVSKASREGLVGGGVLGAFSNGSEFPAVATPVTNAKIADLGKYPMKFFNYYK
jgi:hypothetical protein